VLTIDHDMCSLDDQFPHLYVRVGILLTGGKHLHDRVISRRGDAWAHKTSLTWQFFIQVAPHQARKVRGDVFVC